MAIDRVLVQRRLEKILEANGDPTHRFMRFLEELTSNLNDNSQELDDATGIVLLAGKINRIQQQVGSGIPLTVDTTGFTVDTDFQFTDQTEA